MNIKGIDVSAWNGNIDWKSVANDGVKYAILRITERYNKVDSTFENNYRGCSSAKIPMGVYKYSYAVNVEQIVEEANVVVKTLKGRKLDFPVFLDIEDKCQANLSPNLMMKMIDAFRDIVINAGYKFGIYCGYSWYQSKLPDNAKKYDCWLARYPYGDNGTIQERLRPPVGIAWQYSSKGCVKGISGNVDMNVFYKDYKNTEEGGEKPMGITINQAIDALIATSTKELGYLEKASNAQLDSKKVNAGRNNYTKYWRDLKPHWNGSYWCAVYISWIFAVTFGIKTAKKLLKHENDFPYVYCPTLSKRFTLHSNPKRGDVVIFYRKGEFRHTGLVTKVQGDRFWTHEGNASSGTEITPNGGEVCEKTYLNSQLPGTKFCRPDYSIVTEILKENPFANNVNDPSSIVISRPMNKETKWRGIITATSLNIRTAPTIDAGTCSFSPLKKGQMVDVCDLENGWYYIKHDGKYGFASAEYIVKTTEGKPQIKPENHIKREFVGCVYKPSTKVYVQATGKETLKKYPRLKNGNLVDVLGEEGKRYKVNIPFEGGVIGYVNKSDIKDSKAEYPYLANVCTKQPTSTLNLRKSPVDGEILAEMPNGSNVIVRKKAKNGWYQIRYKKIVGFASREYLQKAKVE